jgi:hypothetical protein
MVRYAALLEHYGIACGTFGRLRPSEGEDRVLCDNVFVEKLLPARTLRELTEAGDCAADVGARSATNADGHAGCAWCPRIG